jgi:hypothetical protein
MFPLVNETIHIELMLHVTNFNIDIPIIVITPLACYSIRNFPDRLHLILK